MWSGRLGQAAARDLNSGENWHSTGGVQHSVQRSGGLDRKSFSGISIPEAATGLENRRARKGTEGSNPSLSASFFGVSVS